MTLHGKLFANAFVTITGIVLIGAASLIGFRQVERSIREVTESSTPYQLKAMEITKTLQEQAHGLMEVAAASDTAEVDRKEGELSQGIEKLRSLSSDMRALRATPGTVEMGRTVGEVEGLTREIIRKARERIRAESQAAASVSEAHRRLAMLADNRATLQASLKTLQGGVIAALTRSTTRSKAITEQFRAIERIKDLFQGLQAAYGEVRGAASAHDVEVVRGRIVFALEGIEQSAGDFPSVDKSARSLRQTVIDAESGPLALKISLLSSRRGVPDGCPVIPWVTLPPPTRMMCCVLTVASRILCSGRPGCAPGDPIRLNRAASSQSRRKGFCQHR